jgi:GNAT superfamily N-acetyltransferase
MDYQRGEFTISTDKSRLDIEVIHSFLDRSYWAAGRSGETIRRSIENSLPFGVYKGDQQVGFARVITDYATFAWIADVFILDPFQGQGLGKWLMEVIIAHPERWMERHDPNTEERPDYWARKS